MKTTRSPTAEVRYGWVPSTDPGLIKRMSKTAEESSELAIAALRCQIQGVDEINPSNGKTNRRCLEDEIGDVIAQCRCTIEKLNLDKTYILERSIRKEALMHEWEDPLAVEKPSAVVQAGQLMDQVTGLVKSVMTTNSLDAVFVRNARDEVEKIGHQLVTLLLSQPTPSEKGF